jgi:metallo-beta-lactamase family protein
VTVKLTFCGAAGCVTGSRYLLQSNNQNILVDCGIFQGADAASGRNLDLLPIESDQLDAVLVTHAHIDHVGLLPRLFVDGLPCEIWGTFGTQGLMEVLLGNSIGLQLRDGSLRIPRLDPDTPRDVVCRTLLSRLMHHYEPAHFGVRTEVAKGIYATWNPVGHLLGAASIFLEIGGTTITFSGDVGRYGIPLHPDPVSVPLGETLIIESTYGAAVHPQEELGAQLSAVLTEIHRRGGVTVIPCFAAGKTQLLMRLLRDLERAKRIPEMPVFVDSPLALKATDAYLEHAKDCREEIGRELAAGDDPFQTSLRHLVQDSQDVRWIDDLREPMVIISASGFMEGGRILRHMRRRLSAPENSVLLLGYQPEDGKGDQLRKGVARLDLPGGGVEVRAQTVEMAGFSGHADKNELLRWCGNNVQVTKRAFVVHGEPASSVAFASTLREKFGWRVEVPRYLQSVEL